MKKYLLLFLIFLIAFSCKKSVHCERWKFYDECIPITTGNYGCGPGPIETANFCGNNLDGVYEGAVIKIQQDQNVKHVRHFVEKVN